MLKCLKRTGSLLWVYTLSCIFPSIFTSRSKPEELNCLGENNYNLAWIIIWNHLRRRRDHWIPPNLETSWVNVKESSPQPPTPSSGLSFTSWVKCARTQVKETEQDWWGKKWTQCTLKKSSECALQSVMMNLKLNDFCEHLSVFQCWKPWKPVGTLALLWHQISRVMMKFGCWIIFQRLYTEHVNKQLC